MFPDECVASISVLIYHVGIIYFDQFYTNSINFVEIGQLRFECPNNATCDIMRQLL